MTALILDGKQVAAKLQFNIQSTIENNLISGGRAPALAVVLVGNDAASEVYVKNKRKACLDVGIHSHAFDLPFETTERQLLALIEQLNTDPTVDGILVQLPLPPNIDTNKIIESIAPHKDVDGFHPYNLGCLAQCNPQLRPCTPYGIIQLLNAYEYDLYGKHAVVVGASNIVGRPMALEFLLAGATVTICHRFTVNLARHITMADIIVVAAGVYNVVNPQWLQPHQTLIDVGMHRLKNRKLHGDVNFDEARKRVAAITPVPGGVGPMTIAALLQNTLAAHLA